MRHTLLGSTTTASSGPQMPTSPMSASAPESGRIAATYTTHHHPHSVLTRASSTVHGASPPHADKYGKRSRSALGLFTRADSVASASSDSSDHHYQNRSSSQHQRQSSNRSTTSNTPKSTRSSSSSPLSVRDDDSLLASSTIDFPADRRQMLVDFVDRSVDDAYNLCHGFGSLRWHPSKTREGVSIYRAKDGKGGDLPEETRLDASVRGKCNVSASFDEMMDTLTTETTSDFVAHESSINPSEFLDGQVLCTLVPRTHTDRFVCVKWHSIKSLAPSVAKHRDYVYVEVVDHFTDRDGRKIGFRLSKSIELDELDAFNNSNIFVRAKTLTLHTFSQVSPGNLELYTMMISDLGGPRLPPWLVQKLIDTAAMRSACVRDYINQKRMDLLVFARPKEMVPLHKRICCVVCTRSFSLVRKKYNCVACGDVICNQCSVHQYVAPPNGMISEFVGKKKARICIQCSSNAKRRELPRRSSSAKQMDHRRSSNGSTVITSSTSSSSSSSSSSMAAARHHQHQQQLAAADYQRTRNGRAVSSVDKAIPHMFHFRPEAKQVANGVHGRNSTGTHGGGVGSGGSGSGGSGSGGGGGRSSGRSSGLSTSRTSSSPDDDALLHQDAVTSNGGDDDQDHQDHHQEQPHDTTHHHDEMNFDNLLDEAALDRARPFDDADKDHAMEISVYRKTLVSADQVGDDEDELTDADDDEAFAHPVNRETTTKANGGVGSLEQPLASPTTLVSPARSTGVQDADNDDDHELIIEEMNPQSSLLAASSASASSTPRSSIHTPRQSTSSSSGSISSSSTHAHVKIVKPVVIKQHVVRKRFGSSATKGSKKAAAARPKTPPLPDTTTPVAVAAEQEDTVAPLVAASVVVDPVPHTNPLRETIVVRSRRATLVEELSDDEDMDDLESLEAAQLADLQVHLDRMTMISESLKSLHQATAEAAFVPSNGDFLRQSLASAAASVPAPPTLADQFATISQIEMRAQQEAALAAGFAQAILDEASAAAAAAAGADKPSVATASFLEDNDEDDGGEHMLGDLSLDGDVHLEREDGSFSDFLADSNFTEIGFVATDGTVSCINSVPGWVAVHSVTTGKSYFYNESCGTTSWTMPTPDLNRRSGSYMVL